MKRVLVVRNDKIGDFMLAWPAIALLAQSGHCEVSVLVPEYTADLARECPWIKHVVIDPGPHAPFVLQQAMVEELKTHEFDAAVALFSNWRNAVTLRHVGIAYRLGPATKIAQFLYTHKLVQRRSQSAKPEWEYNLDLAARCLQDLQLPIESVAPPYMRIEADRKIAARHQIASLLGLDIHQPWLMLHPGSGGSAVNLSPRQYEDLIVELAHDLSGWQVILTAGPHEMLSVGALNSKLLARHVPAAVLPPDQGLRGLVAALANADCFISGSTGPLHIAGALDVPTVGFFPARRSATALRWQPLNTAGRHLPFQATHDKGERSFEDLEMPGASKKIVAWLETFAATGLASS